MKKILKKIGSVFLVLCMVFTMLPTVAFAADASSLESTIESYTGGTGSLSASISGSTVTVTGTVTDAASPVQLNIDAGVTVIWKASITAVSGYLAYLIMLSGEGAFEVAEGGTISATSGFAIYHSSDGGQITVNGGTISATRGNAIYAVGSGDGSCTVTVEDGTVTSTGGGAIKADHVIVNGGTVSATGNNGCAILAGSSGSSLTVSGGTVSSTNYYAIDYTYDNGTVTISGGTVTSLSTFHGAIRVHGTGSTVTVSGGAVLSYGEAIDVADGFAGITGDGVVISWDSNTDNTLYIAGTATDLTVSPEGAAVWATQAGQSGISYTSGSNTGFFEADGVTVAASLSEAANTLASTITSYSSNLQTSVNGSAVTVTGSAEDVGTTLALNILEGISVQWKASITAADTLTDDLIYLSGHGSFEVADGGTVSSANSMAINASGDVTVSGGTVSSADSTAISASGDVTVSGGTVSSVDDHAIVSCGSITVSGGTIRSTAKLPIFLGYIGDLTITGGTIFFYGTASDVAPYSSAQSGDSVIIAWDQSSGTTQYNNENLSFLPTTATIKWATQDSKSGISYTNGSNNGFIAVDGITVSKGNVALSQLSYTDPSTIQDIYNGSPQSIGSVTAANGVNLGSITVYYEGINGTAYEKSTAAPTNTGTYQVTVDVAENDNYNATSDLMLGEYTIHKATAAGVNQNYAVLVNSAQTYTFDLTSLLPSNVDASQVSAYTYVIRSDTNGIFNVTPSVNGTTLALPIASVATAGLSDTVTIGFTSDNYNISNATITVQTVDKTPVTISADMTGGVYNRQPYAYSNATVTDNTDKINVTDSVTLESSYEGIGGTTYGPSADAPTDAGSYQLTLSVPDTDATYIGSAVFTFTIAKRPVTVKADDKSVTVGSDPVFTFTVDGQLSGETALSGEPYLAFAEGNTSKAGSFTINVFLSGVSYTDNYTAADPAYVNGTLIVSKASSSGGSSSGGGSAVTTPASTVSGSTATTETTAKTDSDGKATASVTQSQMNNAIEQAQKAAKETKETPKVKIEVDSTSDAKEVKTILPNSSVQKLATEKMGSLAISSAVAEMTFDGKALEKIASQTSGDVSFGVSRVDNSTLSKEARGIVGDRPIFDFSVTSGDKKITEIDGTVTISIPYTTATGENPNAIVAYYINADGKPELIQNCKYDAEHGVLAFTTTHFSVYAVGYQKVAFDDVKKSAWYADAVTFLAARNITGGITETTFGPSETLTRGQFITLLMRAYNLQPDDNSNNNFSDAGDTYYTNYLAAAKQLGITGGVGDNKFEPEQAVTRQQMFTLLYNALKVIDQLPEGDSKKTLSNFTDSNRISSYAKDAMIYFVKSGAVSGTNEKLLPEATTTRAEMAQVLYKLLAK